MTTTCPYCGASEDPKFLPKRHTDDAIAYACGAVSDGGRALWRSDECHAAEVARITKERDEALARIKRLEEVGDAMAVYEFLPDRLAEKWTAAKEVA